MCPLQKFQWPPIPAPHLQASHTATLVPGSLLLSFAPLSVRPAPLSQTIDDFHPVPPDTGALPLQVQDVVQATVIAQCGGSGNADKLLEHTASDSIAGCEVHYGETWLMDAQTNVDGGAHFDYTPSFE